MSQSPTVSPVVRIARESDLPAITRIYNEGIEDRMATLEEDTKDLEHLKRWYHSRNPRYQVIALENQQKEILGWASLNPFHSRCCYDGVADLSVYLAREARGKGYGKLLLQGLEEVAKKNRFSKLVLTTFADNIPGMKLYKRQGFREVGTYYRQGMLDGRWVDTTIMEKLLD
ncbi:MAG: arsinothricin resistance N-acetyltransferase ArsN1 family A [Bacillota bacterium]|nr:arsinothricin resistance N-acetyltransferase ArsN1 family A [Bacillota bacterium]MDW7678103.1 arsinothricin resistance N-acetyltransferase ArsN1 family A [Bacillota bacterium]